MSFAGEKTLKLAKNGDLIASAGDAKLIEHAPVIYQEMGGKRRMIAGGWKLRGAHEAVFTVARYDRTKPLTIDPGLVYSTYLGGGGTDVGTAIAVDSTGDAYVTGITSSPNFPTTTGAFDTRPCGCAFVTKLNVAGSALVYSTYLGGSGRDRGYGIAIDSSSNAYVTGETSSTDFPTTATAFQTSLGGKGATNAFVTKLNATGSALVYSTYLGGNGDDTGYGIVIDSSGNAYVTGQSDSTNFPITLGAFQTNSGANAFVTKLNKAGSALVYSTYLGGSGNNIGTGIAIDSSGNAYVVGDTTSIDFPTTARAFQTANAGDYDAFVTELNAAGSALVYSTYLGGSNDDQGYRIAVDSSGNAYVAGQTDSTNFPTTSGAFQTGYTGGSDDAFVTKLDMKPIADGIFMAPSPLVYPRKKVGVMQERPVLVIAAASNSSPAVIGNIAVSGAADFSLDTAASTCTIGELLPAGQHCAVWIDFTLSSYKSYKDRGTLTVTTDAATVSPSGGIVQLSVRPPDRDSRSDW
ncbi:MAG: SBBP repeat-containing protein [Candidatus Binataceae bacterium]